MNSHRGQQGGKRKHKQAFGTGRVNWQEKRDKKRAKKMEQQMGKPVEHYELNSIQIGSDKFNEYYRRLFKDCIKTEEEFQQFVNILYDKLPVTFRLNSGETHVARVSSMLKDPGFVKQFLESEAVQQAAEQDKGTAEEVKSESKDAPVTLDQRELAYQSMKEVPVDYDKLKMDLKPFYPGDVLFEMMIPRELLKKNLRLKQIHKLVMQMADSGLITRQEIVSMIPPILLDVHCDHAILDMCAAPGSKTAQLLELIQADSVVSRRQSNTEPVKGFVVANDADPKRAFMLTHQMNRLNAANILITNHNA